MFFMPYYNYNAVHSTIVHKCTRCTTCSIIIHTRVCIVLHKKLISQIVIETAQ